MRTIAHSGVAEVIHGVVVHDPYRWLEDRQLPESEEWVSRQSQICERYFAQNQSYAPFRKIVAETLSVEEIDQATRVENKLFLRKRLPGQEQAAIWLRRDGDCEDGLLIDPAGLGSNAAISILRVAAGGSLLAYTVRFSGSDTMEVRIADVASGGTLPDCLPSAYLRGFKFDSQNDGFYYCIEPRERTENLLIKHHRLGDSALSDLTLFSVPWADHRRLVLLSDNEHLGAMVTEPCGVETVQDLYIATQGANRWSLVYRGMRGKKWPVLAYGRVFLLDMEDAPNGRLLELHEKDRSPSISVPESESRIQKCWPVQGGFLLSYLTKMEPRIERWSSDGERLQVCTLPAKGSIDLLAQCSERSTSVFFLRESYTEAPGLWEIDLSKELLEARLLTATTEGTTAAVRECWYTSRDGMHIPMILIEPTTKPFPSVRPLILFGYGGFGTSERPHYSRLAKILVERGVTIARPAIRGGSEFGAEWHQAATKRQKQRSIDDFIAAAEWLLSEGIATKRHLAIIGSSNGGLLVMAAAMQRPDIFSAVISTGPLTDMVRYELFDHASRWRGEYGTIEDPKDFQALLSYSPYHNVEADVDYPATLFVTGDADDRCNPAHVRKMAAILQGREAQDHPILVDYGCRWGHTPTLSLSERVEGLSRQLAFLCQELSLTLPEEQADVQDS